MNSVAPSENVQAKHCRVDDEEVIVNELVRLLHLGSAYSAPGRKGLQFNPSGGAVEKTYREAIGSLRYGSIQSHIDALCFEAKQAHSRLIGKINYRQAIQLELRAVDRYNADLMMKRAQYRSEKDLERKQRAAAFRGHRLTSTTGEKLLGMVDGKMCDVLNVASWCNYIRDSHRSASIAWLKDKLSDADRVAKMSPSEVRTYLTIYGALPPHIDTNQGDQVIRFAQMVGVILNSPRPRLPRD